MMEEMVPWTFTLQSMHLMTVTPCQLHHKTNCKLFTNLTNELDVNSQDLATRDFTQLGAVRLDWQLRHAMDKAILWSHPDH